MEISKRRVLFHLRWLRFLNSLTGVDRFFREANILIFLVLKMSWQHKRQMNKSQTSRENGFKLTSEEDWQFSGVDFNWDLRKRNGRMVRISVKSYDNGIYFYLKLFKLEPVSDDDRQSERWIIVGQLALTIDEVSAFTALTGSLDVNDLFKEDRGRKSEFDRVVANLIEGRRPSNGLSNSG